MKETIVSFVCVLLNTVELVEKDSPFSHELAFSSLIKHLHWQYVTPPTNVPPSIFTSKSEPTSFAATHPPKTPSTLAIINPGQFIEIQPVIQCIPKIFKYKNLDIPTSYSRLGVFPEMVKWNHTMVTRSILPCIKILIISS